MVIIVHAWAVPAACCWVTNGVLTRLEQNFMFGPWYYSGYKPEMEGVNIGAMWVFAVLGSMSVLLG